MKKSEPDSTENEFSDIEPRFKPIQRREYLDSANEESKRSEQKPKPASRNLPIPLKTSKSFPSFSVVTRTIWTIILLGAFIVIIAAGHFYCFILLLLIDIGIYSEIISLKRIKEKDKEIQFSLALNWYFFVVGCFFFYGKFFGSRLSQGVLANSYVQFFVKYHSFHCFNMWILGFLLFVLALKKGYYRYQFRQFGWAHLTILMVVAQTASIAENLYEGMIWFVIPCLLVIANDVFAYIFGKLFGKTKLIELSPNKTWEGFIGGFVSTMILGSLVIRLIQLSIALPNFQFMLCPKENVTLIPFENSNCKTPYYFLETVNIPYLNFNITHFQIHIVILGIFASFISPFGGYFASGFKRALKIKDFAEIIPGHGGLTDRMDCQILMVFFRFYQGNVHLCVPASGCDWRLDSEETAHQLSFHSFR